MLMFGLQFGAVEPQQTTAVSSSPDLWQQQKQYTFGVEGLVNTLSRKTVAAELQRGNVLRQPLN